MTKSSPGSRGPGAVLKQEKEEKETGNFTLSQAGATGTAIT